MLARALAALVPVALLASCQTPLQVPATPQLGVPITAADAARLDGTVFPDGRGLPPGSGSVAEGQAIYAARCARCHGADGRHGSSGALVGRAPLDAQSTPRPAKTIGQFWPYATTVFDYTRRAMPPQAPGSLSDDEVYALTAWLLHANGVIGADAVMDASTLPKVRMPNRDGFVR